MQMGTARVPHLPAGLPTVPCWGPAGLARIARYRGGLRRPCLRRRRGHSAWPGAICSRRGQSARSGTGFPSPTASKVPGRAGCPHPRRMSPDARRTPARAVGPDHEGGHSHRPSLRRTSGGRHAALPNHHGPASDTNKRAPHLRCGAAGVCAPVQARCSLSGEDCSRHPPTPQPQRVVIGRPRLVGYFCPIPHPDDEEADCE